MAKVVDIYFPLDAREGPNQVVVPVARQQLEHLQGVIRACGWEPNLLNPEGPVTSVAGGIEVIRRARGERLIVFIAGWAYPDFTVTPLFQLDRDLPKLLFGSLLPDFPGAVGLLAAFSGLSQVGIEAERLYAEDFADHGTYAGEVARFLEQGGCRPELPAPIAVEVEEGQRRLAREVAAKMRGMVYGSVGPRSMQMWNKISEADFLRWFGMAREGFDGLRLARMAEQVPVARAERALAFLEEKGFRLELGDDPARHLTREMVLFQMKCYFALLQLAQEYGLDFLGVQDQLDWIDHYPATDLALGLLNNRLRPEGDGETLVAATEADDGAAVTMQAFKLLSGGEPAGFNDLRYWNAEKGLYWFVNSGALAPYFARGSHDSFAGAWSERQTPMYFAQGGGTSSVVVRIPGVVTWARFSYRDHQLYLCAGRGVTDPPDEAQWRERSARCSPDWPHWHIRLCGQVEWYLNTNHPMTACGDWLGHLKALAQELRIPFECYDHLTPQQL